jgi:transposase
VRLSQSRPICERLHPALVLFKKSRRYLPRSAFGQAIDYALANSPLLGVYLNDGRIEIDNNLVENSIRPTALGKKNWLFFGRCQCRPAQCHPLHHYRKLPLPRHRSLRLPP